MADTFLQLRPGVKLRIRDRTGGVSPSGGVGKAQAILQNLLQVPAIRDILTISVRNPTALKKTNNSLVVNVYDRPSPLSSSGFRIDAAHYDPNNNSININLYDFGYLVVPTTVAANRRLIAPYINVPKPDLKGFVTTRNTEFDNYLALNPAMQQQYAASDGNFAIVIDRANGAVAGSSKWLTPLDPETIIAHEIGHSADAIAGRQRVGQEGVALVLERMIGGGRSQAGAVADIYSSAFDIRSMPLAYFDGKNPTSLVNDVNAVRSALGDPEIFAGAPPNYTLDKFYSDVAKLKLEFRNRSTANGVQRIIGIEDSTTGEVILEAPASAGAGELGLIIGSTLGRYIGGSNPLINIASTTVLGTIVQNFSQQISASINAGQGSRAFVKAGASNVKVVAEDVLDDLGSELIANLRAAAVGTVSSLLSLELGRAVGVSGFGAELLSVGTSSVISQVANNAITLAQGGANAAAINNNLFYGLNGQSLFGSIDAAGNITGGVVSSALAGFLGSKLGSLVISPTNTEGAVLSSIGSAVGAAAGTAGSFLAINALTQLGWFGGPLVGSFVGFVVGALLGKLFGKKPPRPPQASQEIELNLASGYWEMGASQIFRAGNLELAKSMALSAEKTINGIISVVVGGLDIAPNANESQPKQRYRVTSGSANPIEVSSWNGSGWSPNLYVGRQADVAVEAGVLAGIRSTRIMGGDLLVKRAIYAAGADDLVTLLGNIQVAEDFGEYLRNAEAINNIIAAQPNSTFAATWMVTLLQAEELGLNRASLSDFFGGAGGFLRSVVGTASQPLFEDFQLALNGGLQLTQNLAGAGVFSALPDRQDQATPGVIASQSGSWNGGRSLSIADPSEVGYVAWQGQATAGNDIWDASGGGPVVMDDLGYEEHWQWNPWDYTYEPYYVEVSGGDDIFIGSAYADTLSGRTGWDWLDGGDGDDVIDGGGDDDVLLGRGGSDRMLGGSGDDYLAGGDGDDYFYDANRTWGLYGGDGDDVLVGGGGTDSLYGDNGDDVFIVDQDGGATWDALTGQAGSDTLSYERFTSGVYVDFATLGGWSWDPTAKYIYGDAIAGSMENVTGSAYNDVILGDAGNNVLSGLGGDDYFDGRDGNDTLVGGVGADALRGGSGTDTASYEHSKQGVVVSFQDGLTLGGDATGDTFDSIENLTGSAYGDELTGDGADNALAGLRGDDIFRMSGGNDLIDGGEGLDSIDAADSSNALSVYYDEGTYDPYYGYYTPGAGWIATVGSGITTFSSIERFVGTAFADSISGSGADEVFEGGAADDYLVGAGGSDTFVFGRGDGQDTVYSSSAGASAILLKDDINWRDVSISGANYNQQYGNLTVGIRGTSDQMTVGSNFYYVNSGNSAGQHNHAIKSLDLGGVSSVDIDMIDWTPYAADENSTVVYGAQNRSDLIFAYAGDDIIYTAGNSYNYESRGNVVYAGDGFDQIFASYGDDQFIYERGNGVDVIFDSGGVDTIVMGPSVAADDVVYEVVKTYGNGEYGSDADLYIGIRDPDRPNAPVYQLSDYIRIASGAIKRVGINSGTEQLNTIEHVRVSGQEIDLTKANIDWAISYYYDGGYYPIALDLDGDGIELRSVEGSRITTVEADGTVTRMGWLGQDDGFLALDRDGNGVIDRIGEISFIGDKEGAKTDLEGLAAYDSNGDGKLDASDARWGEFKVWQDKNQDGFGSKTELVGLDEAGVSSISLKGQLTGFTAADGPDNTVIATTDVVWKDASRTGSAYDVMLARLQVRTDGGAKDVADLDAKARGKKADDIEAKLRGVQTLTPEQAAAIKDKKSKQTDNGEGGRFYRVEDLLEGGSAKVKDGLYSIDPKIAKSVADAGRKLGILDRFADSEWTKLGSTTLGEADMRGVTEPFKKADLSDAQKAVIADARKIVADRKVVDEAKAAERAAKDTADAVLRPAPTPPTAEEIEKLKMKDKFQFLEGETESGADAATSDDADRQQMQAMASSEALAQPSPFKDDAPAANEMSDETGRQELHPVEASRLSADPEPATQAAAPDSGNSPEIEAYGVVIRAANARLVQALASFGDAPAMMASYQGLNVANDPQAAWLSVDAMPSVQRLAAIR